MGIYCERHLIVAFSARLGTIRVFGFLSVGSFGYISSFHGSICLDMSLSSGFVSTATLSYFAQRSFYRFECSV